ncbi:DUF2141 domain-containing protein [Sphingomonas sp.]|uniref:DUF2141 domain-containing protein n=1 Tax=Sphingomonas sp. TaxID=28214 RepID=UPI000BCF20CA|nr:DUF2141 domain-containing protein [Sphingomonas sp.]MBA4760669.1 DUF2141 domain-containing protein [Sphingomonas sp.]OYX52184.1 MAG: hypothetical protein B7Y97_03305 [Sphingomonas sp. 32-66-10]
MTIPRFVRFAAPLSLALIAAVAWPSAASAQAAIGEDAAACAAGNEPALRVTVQGIKDRTGRLKLELYPAVEGDYLRDDHVLVKEGKLFHRSFATTPKSGNIVLCIKAPRPGRYALFLTHDRDGANKFNIWKDGAGVPSNRKLGRSKPKLADGIVNVGAAATPITIKLQYVRGLSGFSPSGG